MTVECDILFHARLHWVCVCRHYTKAAESRFHIFTLSLSPSEGERVPGRAGEGFGCCLSGNYFGGHLKSDSSEFAPLVSTGHLDHAIGRSSIHIAARKVFCGSSTINSWSFKR